MYMLQLKEHDVFKYEMFHCVTPHFDLLKGLEVLSEHKFEAKLEWHGASSPHAQQVEESFPTKCVFLIKINQLACKITVLVFPTLEKLCSIQLISQMGTGEKRRQQKQTTKEKKNLPFNPLRYDSIFN